MFEAVLWEKKLSLYSSETNVVKKPAGGGTLGSCDSLAESFARGHHKEISAGMLRFTDKLELRKLIKKIKIKINLIISTRLLCYRNIS